MAYKLKVLQSRDFMFNKLLKKINSYKMSFTTNCIKLYT